MKVNGVLGGFYVRHHFLPQVESAGAVAATSVEKGLALRGWLIGSRESWLGAASWQSEGSLGSRRVRDREGGVCREGLVSVSEMASAVSASGDRGGNGYGFC
ncbi:hypothetical protein ACFX19_041044 [Malus domestica]